MDAASARDLARSLMHGTLQNVVLRPWFDDVMLGFLSRWFFPLSRAWAAGLAAGTDVDAFARELGRDSVPSALVVGPLSALHRRAMAHAEAVARWEDHMFGPARGGPPAAARMEARRREAAHRLMTGRLLFAQVHSLSAVPPVRFSIPTVAEVEARHGARLGAAQSGFPVPAAPLDWQLSAPALIDKLRVRWLRAPAPVAIPGQEGDRLWARVVEPADRPVRATLVFSHGIGVEEEHWRVRATPLGALIGMGLRLILPEGPGHGRRRIAGYYGGEQAVASSPLGMLDYMQAHIPELGLLVAWARRFGDGPVGVGGVSLGALNAQLLLSIANGWPAPMRPDAALLVTPNRSVEEVVFTGALTSAIGLTKALEAGGWNLDMLDRWRPLLEPLGAPCVDPAAIVAVLGEADEVTPFHGGQELTDDWGLPAENVFIRPRGHFSSALALSMAHDTAPLSRLVAVMSS